MNRGYTAAAYREKVAALRRACPGISITSDVIVGFPGEEEEDFQATLELMREVRFDNLFSFQYSETGRDGRRRDGSPGVRQREAGKAEILQALQAEHTLEKNRACVGRWRRCWSRGRAETESGEMTGRTRGNRIVNFPGTTGTDREDGIREDCGGLPPFPAGGDGGERRGGCSLR